MKKYFFIFTVILNLIFVGTAFADQFIVRKIDINGLQRISKETVYSYLPIRAGQTLSPSKTGAIIRSLYNTGFFEHISLARQNNTLIIHVVERSIIGQLKISGNSAITTDKLMTVMKGVNIAEGRVYNPVILEKIKQSLISQYYQLGYYNAKVDVIVKPLDRGRISININIAEGAVVKVKQIDIIGNRAFSDSTLKKQLDITTPGLLTFYTQTDHYSQEKLDSSLDKLHTFYLDHGYLQFKVKSSKTSMTPDRKSIVITIVIEEGSPYTIKDYTIVGNTIIPRSELMSLINLPRDSTFSRKAVVDSEKAMSDALGDKGYIFNQITLQPQVDNSTKQVFLTFHVTPGKRVYVHRLSFIDNSKTNDVVLRREMTQMEAAVISSSKLDESKHKISMLPFIRDVQMSVVPTPNTDDKVDVNYKVVEDNSAQASLSIGYSQLDHVILSAGFNQKNFLGTGNSLGLNFSNSRYQTYYGISYENPYYTLDGISRSMSLSVSRFDPRAANITRSYTTDQYDFTMVYGIPIGQDQHSSTRVQLGYGLENILIKLSNNVSQQVNDFVTRYGNSFQQLDLIAGISRDGRDKAIFPTKGTIHSLGLNLYLPVNRSSLQYYSLNYVSKWYQPFMGDFIATARGDIGYGSAISRQSDFPFFKNFYAGGMDSVRGYAGNTLGPKDSNGDSTGGNLLADASAGVIFPNYISDNLRTSWFVDVGNVYNTYSNRKFSGSGSGPLRYSTGLEADWLTPLGLIDLSLAKALNPQPGDDREFFQFSLGANFG